MHDRKPTTQQTYLEVERGTGFLTSDRPRLLACTGHRECSQKQIFKHAIRSFDLQHFLLNTYDLSTDELVIDKCKGTKSLHSPTLQFNQITKPSSSVERGIRATCNFQLFVNLYIVNYNFIQLFLPTYSRAKNRPASKSKKESRVSTISSIRITIIVRLINSYEENVPKDRGLPAIIQYFVSDLLVTLATFGSENPYNRRISC